MSLRIAIDHICVPDYRVGFFTALNSRITQLAVFGGEEGFEPSTRDAATGSPWIVRRKSFFLFRRRFAWDERKREDYPDAGVMICPWNPRVLSLWRDLLVCRRKKIPFLLWGHAWGRGGAQGVAFQFRFWLASKADGVICYTETQAALARKMLPHIPVIAAPNACFSRTDCGVSGDENGRDSLIYVGRLIATKKVDLLIKAFALARKNPEFKGDLIIIGDGPERGRLTSLAKELGIKQEVSWIGHESRVERLREYYSKAFVSASPGYVGLSLTQSFAFGVPALIACHETHSPEIEAAQEGKNARFFKSNSPNDLANAILESWREWRNIPNEREKLSKWTAENYSFETMAERFIEISNVLLNRSL